MNQGNAELTKDDIDPVEKIKRIITWLNLKPQENSNQKDQIFCEMIKIIKPFYEIVKNRIESGDKFRQASSYLSQLLQNEKLIIWFRAYLNDRNPKIRMYSIKFLRFLIQDKNILTSYRQKGIHFFIALSLERIYKPQTIMNNSPDQISELKTVKKEVFESLKFINRWISIYALKFPKILGNGLISFIEGCEDKELKLYSVQTLRLFAMSQPDLCCFCSGIKLLIDCAINPMIEQISNELVWTILYLINDPQKRTQIRDQLDLSRWVSVFTEIDPALKKDDQQIKDSKAKNLPTEESFKGQLQLAKRALITTLKSWQGLIYMGNERQALRSLISMLRLPIKNNIRHSIYEIIQELLSLGDADYRQSQGRSCEDKMEKLINNYLTMLIQVLLDCDLYKILIELSGLENQVVAKPACLLLKRLNMLIYDLIPDHHKYTDFLIHVANEGNQLNELNQQDDQFNELISWSTQNINILGNYAIERESDYKAKNQVSKFFYQIKNLFLTNQTGLPAKKINKEEIDKIKAELQNNVDENKFQLLIKQSMAPQPKEEPNKWNWDCILELLQTFLTSKKCITEVLKNNKFLRSLLNYFLPSQLLFVQLEWKQENFIQAKVNQFFYQFKCGYLLLKLLIKDSKGRDILYKLDKSYLGDLIQLLCSEVVDTHPNSALRTSMPIFQDAFHEKPQNPLNSYQRESFISSTERSHKAASLLTPINFTRKMIREYFSWIGLFSVSKHGQKMLEDVEIARILLSWNKLNGMRDHILIHIIHQVDYSKNYWQIFLEDCLNQGSKQLILDILDFLKLLYFTDKTSLKNWVIELIQSQLKLEDDIAIKAFQVMEHIAKTSYDLSIFLSLSSYQIKRVVDLAQLSQSTFIFNLLSLKSGSQLIGKNVQYWVDEQLKCWSKQELQEEYIEKVRRIFYQFTKIDQAFYKLMDFGPKEDSSGEFIFPELALFDVVQFIYKLPWTITIETLYESKLIHCSVHIDFKDNNHNEFWLVGKPQFDAEKNSFRKNKLNFRVKLSIGVVNIDNHFKDITEPYYIQCNYNDKKSKKQYKEDGLIIELKGAKFEFHQSGEQNFLSIQSISIRVRMAEQQFNRIKLPENIYSELAMTKLGMLKLEQEDYIRNFVQSIHDDQDQVSQRFALWTLGQIAMSKYGIEYLTTQLREKAKTKKEQEKIESKKDTKSIILDIDKLENLKSDKVTNIVDTQPINLISDLIRMAKQHPVLSLRGTCIYVLNMICSTEIGRKELNRFTLKTHMNSKSSEFYQFNIFQIGFVYLRIFINFSTFEIKSLRFNNAIGLNKKRQKINSQFFQVWDKYIQLKKNIKISNEDSQKILESIYLMSSQLTSNHGEKQLKKIKEENPELFNDIDLFHHILLILTFYKFKTDNKNLIFSCFEKMFTANKIQQIMEFSAYQQIGHQDGMII